MTKLVFLGLAIPILLFLVPIQVQGSSEGWSNENIDALVDCTDMIQDSLDLLQLLLP